MRLSAICFSDHSFTSIRRRNVGSYLIYVIDNNPPAFFTFYLTACQFIKINIYSKFKYCQQRSNYNDLFLLNESSRTHVVLKDTFQGSQYRSLCFFVQEKFVGLSYLRPYERLHFVLDLSTKESRLIVIICWTGLIELKATQLWLSAICFSDNNPPYFLHRLFCQWTLLVFYSWCPVYPSIASFSVCEWVFLKRSLIFKNIYNPRRKKIYLLLNIHI